MTDDTNPETSVRVGALCGSLRPGSYTRMALRIALEGAAEVGAETDLIDLSDFELPFCTGDDSQETAQDVGRLQARVESCQGLILGTPEYHGSYSGVLKNAIDLMGFDQFGGKMIGLVGVAGGAMGALSALASLRTVGRSLHSWVVPEQAMVPNAWKAFEEDGQLKDPSFDKRLREVGRQVARFSYLHSSDQAMDFLRLWEISPVNPGGD
jgi:NAD(P)H-dependent FMN reductase